MIKSIHFQNFKALRDATLPLGPFTLIVGPNGSGKSTAMEAMRFVREPRRFLKKDVATAGCEDDLVEISVEFAPSSHADIWTGARAGFEPNGNAFGPHAFGSQGHPHPNLPQIWFELLDGFRIFSFDASEIAKPVQTQPFPELAANGSNLAAVLDALTDSEPERFEALNAELHGWMPEFDRVLFETPEPGMKGFLLRTSTGHRIRAVNLSHGTRFALALLTVAFLPSPPNIVCFEEPDHGIHPRLLREIRDGMYRLAYPQDFGETRQPVQVIATTHSPYLLDLYKEHPEEIVIAQKGDRGAHFEGLSEKPHIAEILEGAPLGEIWFSGVLGGVPANT